MATVDNPGVVADPVHTETATIDEMSFWPRFLPVIRAIANATFVAIDLEMTGIFKESNYGQLTGKRPQMNLQQYYTKVRHAANKYSAVQLGITCVEEDRKNGVYIAKTFNFNINPLFLHENEMGVHRDVTFATESVAFLLANEHDMNAIYQGPTYLSQVEQFMALIFWEVEQAKDFDKIHTKTSASNFPQGLIEMVRRTVLDFIESKKTLARGHMLDFLYKNHSSKDMLHIELVLKLYFPTYPFHRRGDCIRVDTTKSPGELFSEEITNQKRLSYVVEALTGHVHLDQINPRWLAIGQKNRDMASIKAELTSLQDRLAKRRPTIVGHNLFGDLIYIARTFFGALHKDVNDFKRGMHDLFPRIFDTKLMATMDAASTSEGSSLPNLFDYYNTRVPKPSIVRHKSSEPYGDDMSHEAGYDSWITAQLFVKLVGHFKVNPFSHFSASISDSALDTATIVSEISRSQPFRDLGCKVKKYGPVQSAIPTSLYPLIGQEEVTMATIFPCTDQLGPMDTTKATETKSTSSNPESKILSARDKAILHQRNLYELARSIAAKEAYEVERLELIASMEIAGRSSQPYITHKGGSAKAKKQDGQEETMHTKSKRKNHRSHQRRKAQPKKKFPLDETISAQVPSGSGTSQDTSTIGAATTTPTGANVGLSIMDQDIPSMSIMDAPAPDVSIMDQEITNDLRAHSPLVYRSQSVPPTTSSHDHGTVSAGVTARGYGRFRADDLLLGQPYTGPRSEIDTSGMRRYSGSNIPGPILLNNKGKQRASTAYHDAELVNPNAIHIEELQQAIFDNISSLGSSDDLFGEDDEDEYSDFDPEKVERAELEADIERAARREIERIEAIESAVWIPVKGDPFWTRFENKLRIYRIQSRVCDIMDQLL